MNAWQWWSWCLLLILQGVQAEEISVSDNAKNKAVCATGSETHQERKRRDLEWTEEMGSYPNSDAASIDLLPASTKRNPILSRWGGQRLSDLLYFKRRPAFSSWGGKRGPAFSSWGGKRSAPTSKLAETQNQLHNTTFIENDLLTPSRDRTDEASDYNVYEFMRNEMLRNTGDENKLYPLSDTDHSIQNYSSNEFNFPAHKVYPILWKENNIFEYNKENPTDSYDYNDENSIQQDFGPENSKVDLFETIGKRARPSFKSWGGKRSAIFDWANSWVSGPNHWPGKKATAFNSGEGKRTPAFNSWGGKRSPVFNSWGGKRRTAYTDWRDNQENNNWDALQLNAPSQREKRSITFPSSKENYSPSTNTWAGGNEYNYDLDKKRATAFHSWGGKRTNTLDSFEEKRAHAFNSWGGKRATPFHSWGGKRTPTFRGWEGRRPTAFNSWGGKRATAFNSWGGKRTSNNDKENTIAEFNNRDDKESVIYNNEDNQDDENPLDEKRSKSFNKESAKRLPAFHSWGGKRFQSLTTQAPKENRINFLGSGTDQNYLLNGAVTKNFITETVNSEGSVDSKTKETEIADEINSEDFKSPYQLNDDYITLLNNNSDEDSGPLNDIIKRNFHLVKDDDGKRNPAFYSWGGKRGYISHPPGYYGLNKEEQITLADMENFSNNDVGEENLKIGKRNHDVRYNPEFLSRYDKSQNSNKRWPIFSSWGGKRNARSSGIDNLNFFNKKLYNVRKKRYTASDNDNINALIMSDSDSTGNYEPPQSTLTSDVNSEVPNGMTICCIKRAQYGDRNLFTQMFLRTNSFRDLSWPTTRPIRRGANFYSWGGKRSSL